MQLSLCFNKVAGLSLQKRSSELQLCLSMYDLSVDTMTPGVKGVNHLIYCVTIKQQLRDTFLYSALYTIWLVYIRTKSVEQVNICVGLAILGQCMFYFNIQ